MNIFLDTADVELIRKHYETGIIDGVTTNPTLIMKSHKDPEDVYQELADIGIEDISMEVVDSTVEGMIAEAERLVDKFGNVVTIKVPCTREGLLACKHLTDDGVRVNVTLIFSPSQAILAAKSGATYVSPFVGRVFDQHWNGIYLIEQIADVFATHQVKTEILGASIREPIQVSDAFRVGADICTIPLPMFYQLYKHILTDKGLEQFDKDWTSLQEKL